MRALVLAVFAAACAHAPPPPPLDSPSPAPRNEERHFTVWLGGARVGTVIEREKWTSGGVSLERTEHMKFYRGDALVGIETRIEVQADSALVPSRVEWTEDSGAGHRTAIATHDARGWHIDGDDARGDMTRDARGDMTRDARGDMTRDARGDMTRDARGDMTRDARDMTRDARGDMTRDARGDAADDIARAARPDKVARVAQKRARFPFLENNAVPSEIVPLLVKRDVRFSGHVFLIARGFLSGIGRIEPAAPGRLVARLAFDGGAVAEATIDVDGDGEYVRVIDGEGVIARRATAAQAAEPFEPVDLIAATSIAIAGRGEHLVIDGDIVLPQVPGQRAHPAGDGIEVELSSKFPGALPESEPGPDRSSEIRSIVGAVRASIAPSLGAGPTTAKQAAEATAGDCTTFALAYAAHAAKRSIPTRVVTGLRVDGDRLIRHRWAVSWTGSAWIAVDAAFGAAPAGGDLIGLAVHDADDAGLVAGEAALTMVRSALRR